VYRDLIREVLAKNGKIGTNPAHVEAWMRVQHSTLDGLSFREFTDEVMLAAACIAASTNETNERLAKSMRLQ
jgi:hypothetical protein